MSQDEATAPPPAAGERSTAALPREAARKAIHAAAGAVAAAIVWLATPAHARAACLAALALALAIEAARRRLPALGRLFERALGPMLRSTEARHLTGATTLALGIAATAFLFPRRFAVAGLLYAAFGDAAGAIIGRAFGAHRLPGSRKSVEGTAAVLLVAALVGWGAAALTPAAAILAAVAVALIEAAPLPLDDNLLLPVLGAAAAATAAALPF